MPRTFVSKAARELENDKNYFWDKKEKKKWEKSKLDGFFCVVNKRNDIFEEQLLPTILKNR